VLVSDETDRKSLSLVGFNEIGNNTNKAIEKSEKTAKNKYI
jgi:hypothetical protein